MRIRLLALAACLVAGLFLTSATASGPASSPNAVTVWNANAGEASVAACCIGGYGPQEARMYAMMHVAIHDALRLFEGPILEVHLSNIHQREAFRHHSYVSLVAKGVICGLGAHGYALAVAAVARLLRPAA